jgi:hypothetical protein
MSAKLQPEWIERRAHIDPETGARQKRLLVIGEKAAQIAAAFSKLMPNCHIESAARADHAIMAMASGHFDATLVDCREDERFHRLAVVAARQFKEGRVALLASDHFLPDEKAVLGNLDIFGSHDDSAKLLASLRLKAKPPVRTKPAQENADFETALRAELEALHSKAGQVAASPSAAPQDEMLIATRSETEAEVTADAALPSAPEEACFAAEQTNIDLQSIENTSEFPVGYDAGFLDALSLELNEIQLLEPAPADVIVASGDPRAETAEPAPDLGTVDLFGNPVADSAKAETFEFAEDEPAAETFPDDGGLFTYAAAAPQMAVPAERAAPAYDLDLFGFSLSEIRERQSFEPAALPEDLSGTLNLFDAPAARLSGTDARTRLAASLSAADRRSG